jgi:CelD/BcsL family acetyltransferase involved in cellulose biosynthesis
MGHIMNHASSANALDENVHIRTRKLDSISGLEHDWPSLLDRTNADSLFMSFEWLETWWSMFGEELRGVPSLVIAETGDRLSGLAPLYRRRVSHRRGLRGTRLEMIGGAWRTPGVGFSERLAFLADASAEARIMDALASEMLADPDWDDLVVTYTPAYGPTARTLERMAQTCGGYLRRPDRMEAWEIPLAGDVDAFRQRIGPNTRSRVFGSRARLSAAGHVREWIADPDRLEHALDLLDELYRERWGRGFDGHLRRLYGAVAARQTAAGHPAVSVLEYDHKPVSVLLNLRAGEREYAIASAFREVDVKRVSPGWLHLGLAIERACRDGMSHFDLLGGNGKQEQYKRHLGGERSDLVSYQLIRNPWLVLVYRSWDRVRSVLSRTQVA